MLGGRGHLPRTFFGIIVWRPDMSYSLLTFSFLFSLLLWYGMRAERTEDSKRIINFNPDELTWHSPSASLKSSADILQPQGAHHLKYLEKLFIHIS